MSEAPKLYNKKRKKAQLKQNQQLQQQQQEASPSLSSASSSTMATQPSSNIPNPPPQPPKEPFARRFKFLWPLLLTVNFAVGAYLFMRTKKKDASIEGGEVPSVPGTPVSSTTAAATASVIEKPVSLAPVLEPVKLREPIPENQQRELFKWLLEEKRKVKPKDPEEKKRIDEEKAILKQFIRAKAIPSL